jgi:hypothetical protein
MKKIKELSNETLISLVPAIAATAPIEEVSAKYSFLPTLTAINYLRDAGWLPVMAGQSSVRKPERNGFQKHMIRFTRPDLVVNGHRMDMLLYNSHDRGCAFKLVGGVFRFVCSNGMVIGDKMAEYSHRHVGFSPEKFIESAGYVNGHVEKTAGVIEDWQTIEMTEVEQGVFARTAHNYIYPEQEKAPIRADQLLTTRRYEDSNKKDLWTTFNTVQENALRGGLRGRNAKGRRTTTRGVKSIDKDKRLNQALWLMAEEMEKLKA